MAIEAKDCLLRRYLGPKGPGSRTQTSGCETLRPEKSISHAAKGSELRVRAQSAGRSAVECTKKTESDLDKAFPALLRPA